MSVELDWVRLSFLEDSLSCVPEPVWDINTTPPQETNHFIHPETGYGGVATVSDGLEWTPSP